MKEINIIVTSTSLIHRPNPYSQIRRLVGSGSPTRRQTSPGNRVRLPEFLSSSGRINPRLRLGVSTCRTALASFALAPKIRRTCRDPRHRDALPLLMRDNRGRKGNQGLCSPAETTSRPKKNPQLWSNFCPRNAMVQPVGIAKQWTLDEKGNRKIE